MWSFNEKGFKSRQVYINFINLNYKSINLKIITSNHNALLGFKKGYNPIKVMVATRTIIFFNSNFQNWVRVWAWTQTMVALANVPNFRLDFILILNAKFLNLRVLVSTLICVQVCHAIYIQQVLYMVWE
jgi:hypothetical protein